MGQRESATTKLVLEVPDGQNLDALIGALVGAINRHADAIAKPGTSLAEALKSGGSSGDNTKLDAIVQMLNAQAGNAANLALIMDKLNLIHGLLADLGDLKQVQTQIDELTKNLRTSSDTVEGAINQDKGD